MAVGSEMLLVLAALRVTSWAAALCSRETTSSMEKVRPENSGSTIMLSQSRLNVYTVWHVCRRVLHLNLWFIIRRLRQH